MTGKDTVRREHLSVRTVEQYRGTFTPEMARFADGDALPPGWEGLLFPFDTEFSGLRADGTPEDDVLPHIDLPRRMYAGESTTFHRPILIGSTVEQRVRAGTVVEKQGRNGRLVFADIIREYLVDGELAVESIWHDVFLEHDAAPSAAARTHDVPENSRSFALDSRQLFRFSALTGNTHRVHYDRQWAREQEGLPDLLVHGPLTRLLMIDAAMRAQPSGDASGARPRRYECVATGPLFVDREMTLGVRPEASRVSVLALDEHSRLAARGTVEW